MQDDGAAESVDVAGQLAEVQAQLARMEQLLQSLQTVPTGVKALPAILSEYVALTEEAGRRRALAARDPDAAIRLATAARLETTLAAAMQPLPVDSALMGRILSATSGHAGHALALRPTPRLAAWAFAAMVMFLSTGYLAGLALPATQGEDVFAGLMFGSSSISLDADIDADAGSLL